MPKNISNIHDKFVKQLLSEQVEKLPRQLNKKVMSLYEELIQKGRKEGVEEGIEKGILNSFDNGFTIEQIRLISGESSEAIKQILSKNLRKF